MYLPWQAGVIPYLFIQKLGRMGRNKLFKLNCRLSNWSPFKKFWAPLQWDKQLNYGSELLHLMVGEKEIPLKEGFGLFLFLTGRLYHIKRSIESHSSSCVSYCEDCNTSRCRQEQVKLIVDVEVVGMNVWEGLVWSYHIKVKTNREKLRKYFPGYLKVDVTEFLQCHFYISCWSLNCVFCLSIAKDGPV